MSQKRLFIEEHMTLKEISNIRINNQKVVETDCSSAKEIVGWMGAVQAQDYLMAKLALGIRLSNSTGQLIEDALNKGEILRTHILRPTWHFVSAEDIYWMLGLTAGKIQSSLKSRHNELEITGSLLLKTNSIIESSLLKQGFLTREELSLEFKKAKINLNGNRLSHLLLYAELEGIICSGPLKGKKLSYALLHDRAPNRKALTRDESLAELAKRYFTSHGPATFHDFSWWSGLSVQEAKQALEFVKPDFISETIDSKEYWFKDSAANIMNVDSGIHLLPAYDEFLISYKDRSASLKFIDNKKVISDNGIFRPVIVINGQVAGLWKMSGKNGNMLIEITFLHPQDNSTMKATKSAARAIADFYGIPARISFNNDSGKKG